MSDKQAVTLTPGYLLHARPFRDSSVIGEFFTEEYGRQALVARGARRPKSKLKGQLRPFQRCLISWVSRGSLGTLTALEADAGRISKVPRRVLSAYYVNELVMRALRPGDSQADVFERYERFLNELDSGNEAVVLRLFERDLLTFLGYGLQLTHMQDGNPVLADNHYHFDFTEGPSLTSESSLTFPGSSLIALADGQLTTAASLSHSKRLLRAALERHLGATGSKVRQVLVSMETRRKEWRQNASASEDKS